MLHFISRSLFIYNTYKLRDSKSAATALLFHDLDTCQDFPRNGFNKNTDPTTKKYINVNNELQC